MQDTQLVARLARRDPQALGAVYDRYADRLFTYAVGQLGGDRDAAADAVSDTFLLAYERIGQLRDPGRLRPWLYAITRSECLRRHRSTARVVAFGEEHDVIAVDADPGQGMERAEAQGLMAQSLASLNEPDREVLDLALRHDLDATAVASVMGLSATHVGARLSRARKQLEKAVVSAMYVRTRGRDCAGLAQILSDESVEPALLRKRVSRHVDDCPECRRRRPAMIAAIPSLGVLPMLMAPSSLREALVGAGAPTSAGGSPSSPVGESSASPVGAGTPLSVAASGVAAQAARVSGDRPAFGADGFPVVGVNRQRTGWLFGAAAALLLLLGAAAVLVGGNVAGVSQIAAGGEPQAAAPVPTAVPGPQATPPAEPDSGDDSGSGKGDKGSGGGGDQDLGLEPPSKPPAVPVQGSGGSDLAAPGDSGGGLPLPAPSKAAKPVPAPQPKPTSKPTTKPTKSPKPTPSPTLTPTPTPTPTHSALPVFTWSFVDLAAGTCPVAFEVAVTVTVTSGQMATATATWTDVSTSATGHQELTRSGSQFTATVSGIPTQTQVLMSVQGTSQDGRPVAAQTKDISHVCPG